MSAQILKMAKQAAWKRLKFITKHKEELVEAWVAKTGVQPDEACLMQQTHEDGSIRIWIEAQPDRCMSHREMIRQLVGQRQNLMSALLLFIQSACDGKTPDGGEHDEKTCRICIATRVLHHAGRVGK